MTKPKESQRLGNEVPKETCFTDYSPPFDLNSPETLKALDGLNPFIREFLLLCIQNESWKKIPKTTTEERWRINLEILFYYFFGHETLEEAGRRLTKPPSKEAISHRIRNTLHHMRRTLSQVDQDKYSDQLLDINTRLSRKIGKGRKIEQTVKEMLARDTTPKDIYKALDMNPGQLRSTTRKMEMHPEFEVEIPKFERLDRLEIGELITALRSSESFAEVAKLFKQIDYRYYLALMQRKKDPVISSFKAAYDEIITPSKKNITYAIQVLDGRICVGIAPMTVHTGSQKGVKNYYFIRTDDIEDARKILKSTFCF